MLALTVTPRNPGSARLEEVPEASFSDGAALVETLQIGVCGTDAEILSGHYGWAPPGSSRLIVGHESLGRVLECPPNASLVPGDLVAAIVRRPDPVPCPNCAAGEWDMCRNGEYTECGIKERHGYCVERFRTEPEYLVKVPPSLDVLGVLIEPASIVAKAWEQIERIGKRALWHPERVLVTGAGPIGLLAALLGVQRGLEVHVLDRVTEGPKPALVTDLGATYHSGTLAEAAVDADVLIECTGVGRLVLEAMQHTTHNGIICLTGISSGAREIPFDAAGFNRSMVLENDVVFGSVNANRRHYEAAVDALAKAAIGWLSRLITRRVPLSEWPNVLQPGPEDVKRVIQLKSYQEERWHFR